MSLLALSAKYNTENFFKRGGLQRLTRPVRNDERHTGCNGKGREIYEEHVKGKEGEKQKK